jgi:threonine aldolase
MVLKPLIALWYLAVILMLIDFRSDTVTRPTPSMLEAMMNTKVGDDVLGDDPTVNNLEVFAANMFRMEAAVFCPSGTMTNQIAIKCHTQPGDEVICEAGSHVYQYEGGGIAFNSGASVRLINGDRGCINAEQVLGAINPDDVHKPYTSLVSLENTANRGGGSCYDINEIKKIREVCDQHSLSLHLDGARLFNALVVKNEKPEDYGRLFHSISICLINGLGCPVGSLLLGNKEFIKKARRVRKVLGGGMRQVGYLAAAGIYALQNNIERLAQDHHHAQQIVSALKNKTFVGEILPVETNIIILEVKDPYTPASFVAAMKEKNILTYAISSTQVRMVVHLDITEEMVQKTIETFEQV